MKEMIETWQIHDRINRYLLGAVDEDYLNDVASSKGRSVLQHFVHIHNVRLMWLKVAAPDLMATQVKIEKENEPGKEKLIGLLEQSGEAITALLEKGFKENKIKGFKPHPAAFMGYLISHESHHRGQAILVLKQSGHKVDPKILYGMWEWGSR